MKKFILKIWNWLKTILRKTQFDNILFEKGIKEVEKFLLSKEVEVEINIGKIYDNVVKALLEKFGHIKPVQKFLNKALEEVNSKLEDNAQFIRLEYAKKIETIMAKLIEWYNNNL